MMVLIVERTAGESIQSKNNLSTPGDELTESVLHFDLD